MKITHLVHLFFFICFACSDNSTKNENVSEFLDISHYKEKDINATDLFEEMVVVKLETKEDVIISEIMDFLIYNERIVVLDYLRSSLFIFNTEGKFLDKVHSQGKGPGEYLGISDFLIDKKNETIEILDHSSRKIHIFDFETLSYQKSIHYSLQNVSSFAKSNGHYYFQTNGAVNKIDNIFTKSEIISFNFDNGEYYALIDDSEPLVENEPHYFWQFNKIFYTNQNGQVFASLAWHDDIYSVQEDAIKPIISIEAGKRSYPDAILNAPFDDKVAFMNSTDVNGKLNLFHLIFRDEHSLIFVCQSGSFESGEPLLFFSFNDGQNTFFCRNPLNNFFEAGNQPIDFFKEQDGWMISVIYPFHLENEKLLKDLDISPHDNPLLLFFKPHQFL